MAVSEKDVSILIPTYNRREMTCQAVRSALATGAEEIIVSDNRSTDDTVDGLMEFDDPRLRIVVQEKNIGLWENHLALLDLATRPWIKFLHSDDYIAPGGLRQMVDQIGPDTSVVAALAVHNWVETGEKWYEYELAGPRRFSSDEYMERLLWVGQELGSPSCTLVRTDMLRSFSRDFWKVTMSCDYVFDVVAASMGEVVLLPAGPIVTGRHMGRSTFSDGGLSDTLTRHRNATLYLMASHDPRVRRLADIFAFVDVLDKTRIALAYLALGRPVQQRCLRELFRLGGRCLSWGLLRDLRYVVRRLRRRYGRTGKWPIEVAEFSGG